jgi:UDP-N-acetyl-D-glucosamine dehydrogenase
LILGVTFKENTRDTRNSPAVRVMELLAEKGANVAYHDNNAPNLAVSGTSMESTDIDYSDLKSFDAVIILVNHSNWDLEQIIENSQLVIDARNATGPFGPHDNVVKL